MAQGDVVCYNQFLEDFGDAQHHLSSATFVLALITDTTQTAAVADPAWGAGRTTNLNSLEVTAGGNYAAEGATVSAADAWTRSGATCTFDLGDQTWSQNASNPGAAAWGILYNGSHTDNAAVLSLDLGGAFDMTTGDLVVTWNASGIFTLA